LGELVASFSPTRLPFPDYDGYVPMNPSVINHNGKPLVLVRTINYLITEDGRYAIRSPDGSDSGSDWPISTRNYLVALGGPVAELVTDIALPTNLPEPQYQLVRGFEDTRLFEWRGELWSLSTVRELNSQGWCEQVIAPIVVEQQTAFYGNSWRAILPKSRANEKNWMPWVRSSGELLFVYRLGTLINLEGEIVAQYEPAVDSGHISGGSQVVEIEPDVNLCIVHEARAIPGSGLRFYQHRFARLAADGKLAGLSRPFFFAGRQIEFAAGLALFGDKLMVSYGVKDREAWIAMMDLDEVLRLVS
jgi:hypothetical protein